MCDFLNNISKAKYEFNLKKYQFQGIVPWKGKTYLGCTGIQQHWKQDWEPSRSVGLRGGPNAGKMAATSCKANMAADICQMLLFRCTFSCLWAAVGHLRSLFRPDFVCRARLSTHNGSPGAK